MCVFIVRSLGMLWLVCLHRMCYSGMRWGCACLAHGKSASKSYIQGAVNLLNPAPLSHTCLCLLSVRLMQEQQSGGRPQTLSPLRSLFSRRTAHQERVEVNVLDLLVEGRMGQVGYVPGFPRVCVCVCV